MYFYTVIASEFLPEIGYDCRSGLLLVFLKLVALYSCVLA